MRNIVECVSVVKDYGSIRALDNINLQIPDDGGIVGLLGPNGSGKTTFIKLITGLLAPTYGEVRVAGRPVGVESKSVVSYLSDFYSLVDSYTVTQELAYFEDFFVDFDREKAEKMIADLGINPKQKVKTLSKGTKEKLALVLTLSRRAKLFVLDEPIAGVDPAARDYVLNTILAGKDKDATMIISTHLISEIEQYFNHIVFLKEGRVVLSGKADEIREREGKTIDELFREVFRWI